MESLAICNLLIIAATCWVSFLGFRSSAFEDRFIFWPEMILGSRQYYRLITSAFLHANGRHLFFNLLTLYFFGTGLEMDYGAVQFLLIYFASIAGGSLLSLWIHRQHDYRAYGASGGVAGVVFAHILLFPGGNISMMFLPIGIPAWLYAILYMAYSFHGMKTQRDHIGHDAHLGGAMAGLFAAAALHPEAVQYSPKLFAALAAGSGLVILYVMKNPMFLPMSTFTFPARRRGKDSDLPEYKKTERQVDAILQKVSEKGIHSLTEEEKKVLNATSEKLRRRAESKKAESKLSI